MSYQTFQIQQIDEGQIVRVSINRPKSMNAMNPAFFQQIQKIFNWINTLSNVRVVILTANGKGFTSGLDLKEFGGLFSYDLQQTDVARQSIRLYQTIKKMQKQFLSIIECKVPVISGIHSFCVGGGIDLICMTDIRYCTKDAKFTIKEIDIGMAADLGTLQLFPNITGNQSTFRQLAYTGRWMNSQQAKQIGLVSKVFQNNDKLKEELLLTAKAIASKSPVGIHALKHIMRRQQYKKVQESLSYMARTNSSMLFTKDTMQAISAFLQKRRPTFGKL